MEHIQAKESELAKLPHTTRFLEGLKQFKAKSEIGDNALHIQCVEAGGGEFEIGIPNLSEFEAKIDVLASVSADNINKHQMLAWLRDGIKNPTVLLHGATVKDLLDVNSFLNKVEYGVLQDPILERMKFRYVGKTQLLNGYLHCNFRSSDGSYECPYLATFVYSDDPQDKIQPNPKTFPVVRYFAINSDTTRVCAVQQLDIGGGGSITRAKQYYEEYKVKTRELAGKYENVFLGNGVRLAEFLRSYTDSGLGDDPLFEEASSLVDVDDWYSVNMLESAKGMIPKYDMQLQLQKEVTRRMIKDFRQDRACPPAHLISLALVTGLLHKQGVKKIEIPIYLPLEGHVIDRSGESGSVEESNEKVYNHITDVNMRLARELAVQIPGAQLDDPGDDLLLRISLPQNIHFKNQFLNTIASKFQSE